MPQPIRWTEDRDDAIRTLRGHGASWNRIAAQLAVSRWTAIQRAKALGAHIAVIPRPRPDRAAEFLADPDRAPLPPGHPRAWAILTAGTLLQGTPYPHPDGPAGDPDIEEHLAQVRAA